MKTYKQLVTLVLPVISLCSALQCRASDFGVTGLFDVPTARMAADGEFTAAISRQRLANIFNLTYQTLPWAEMTFRYTIFDPGHVAASAQTKQDRDRSWEAKFRLLKEDLWRPEVAIGGRDVIGTGVWSGEYVVASKRFGKLDATIGMGWGRFADRGAMRNPLNYIDPRFGDRLSGQGGAYGGQLRGITFFRGPNVSLMGGFSYDLPRWNTRILVEYNPDTYRRELGAGTIRENSPWSFGFEWEPLPSWRIAFSRQQGDQWGFRLSGIVDTKTTPPRKKIPIHYSSAEERSLSGAPGELDLSSPYDRLLYDTERSGLLLRRGEILRSSPNAILEVSNQTYAVSADAIHRALTLAEAHLPSYVESISIVLNENNMRLATIHYQRKKEEIAAETFVDERRITVLPGRKLSRPTNVTNFLTPRLGLGINLSGRVQVMDPDNPLKHQVYVKLTGRLHVGEGWNIFAVYSKNIRQDFDTVRGPNSHLHHVRSEINQYLVHGKTGLESLIIERTGGWRSSIYYRAYGGVLEEMFTGGGFEALYHPFRSRVGVGIAVNGVQQRDYYRGFGRKDYSTNTGFLSLYYGSPFYDFDFAIHLGRYLARDTGITYEARRTFDNGFQIGAFFTRTNVPARLFGEGSFDKGLIFRFPFSAFLPGNTRARYSTTLRPLERDGGRRLHGYGRHLWWDIRTSRYDALERNKLRMVPR